MKRHKDYNEEAERDFLLAYERDYQRQKETYEAKLKAEIFAEATDEKFYRYLDSATDTFEYEPKHLFLSSVSYSYELGQPFYVILPKPIEYWRYTAKQILQRMAIQQSKEATNTFKVIFESGEIISFTGIDLGEGEAMSKEIILSNGDTPDFTRFDFEVWSEEGKILKAFLDTVIQKSDRIFDFKRKCWFVKTELVESILLGINTLIKQNTLNAWYISDKREIIEDFDSFFTDQAKGQLPQSKKLSKEELDREFFILIKPCNIAVDDISVLNKSTAKVMYRRAALALHPDRNNGDGSKMAQLNVIWSQLQEYL